MTRVATFPLRLPVSLKTALEKIAKRDGTSMNQFLVIAAAGKISAMETESFLPTGGHALTAKTSGASWTARAASRRDPRTDSSNGFFVESAHKYDSA